MELVADKEYMIYVTKYALTQGIQKIIARYSGCSELMWGTNPKYLSTYHGSGKDWHFGYADAVKKAKDMKKKENSVTRKAD